ncbi:DUF7059 domain-containing protein [Nesterenkonia flava]|uniref:Methyltransferase n=1 Tax=Nesterenkonia flava TaxID=469799 RepID=A0ABU1FWC8_9MICC|nr:methyltransferase [Nesterenkonia flava]MDR5712989.1 methyltransferase [Nesterenkonia flava]
MAPTSVSPPPPLTEEPELLGTLREDLLAADYTNAGVAQLLGEEAVSALDREQVVPGQLRVTEALAEHRPGTAEHACAVLAAFWLLAVEVTAAQLDAALPRLGVHGLKRLRLVQVGDEDEALAAPTCDLRPYQVQQRHELSQQPREADLWVASDLSAHQVQGALPHDHVLGVGQASLTLAGITHRRRVGTALDIGTGCGIHVLHLLDHAERVVATDISARALDFTRFNLLLNAETLRLDPRRLSDRVELLHGSLLEPVAGRTFDLVVSNPPFVITPRRDGETDAERYTYRDAGRRGDSLMDELITSLPAVLNPSGTVQMLGNWEIEEGTDWSARPRTWVEQASSSAPVEAWFIQRDQQTPAQYAETWLRDASEERDIPGYRSRYHQYLQDFESRRIAGIGFGMIWLRRPALTDTGEPLRRFEEITSEVQQPLGPIIGQTVERCLAVAQDLEAELEQTLSVAPDVTEERYQRFGAPHPEVILARQGAGLRRARPISSAAAGFLSAADGEFTASQLITAVTALTETDEAALRAEVVDLYTDGFLHP